MSSSILHNCPFCGHATDISEMLADFIGNPHCTQCGLSASEGHLKAQDDLVSLFNAHMNMGPTATMTGGHEAAASRPPITYSITQHYHHSAHVAQKAAVPRPVQQGDAPSETNETAGRVFEVLRHNNVNPSSLTPSQLELFAHAMPEQQSRLVQMWQICPDPSKSVLAFAHPTKDLEMRDSTQLDNGHNENLSAEPYILAGYGLGVPNPGSQLSNDPIYQAGGQRWWERTEPAAMDI
ncbi:uncharacterized protein BDV17DRAFT_258010 [Aspergillus undulatus]|uniref:uncharacterized protein n=1 Tax=Aspergillus undulatus TaxID=1810928 RepID=UPI003CCDA550